MKTGQYAKVGLCYNKAQYAKEPVGGPARSWCVIYPETNSYYPDAIKRGVGYNCKDWNCPTDWLPFDNNTQCYKKGYSDGKFNYDTYRCSLGKSTRYGKCSGRK